MNQPVGLGNPGAPTQPAKLRSDDEFADVAVDSVEPFDRRRRCHRLPPLPERLTGSGRPPRRRSPTEGSPAERPTRSASRRSTAPTTHRRERSRPSRRRSATLPAAWSRRIRSMRGRADGRRLVRERARGHDHGRDLGDGPLRRRTRLQRNQCLRRPRRPRHPLPDRLHARGLVQKQSATKNDVAIVGTWNGNSKPSSGSTTSRPATT